MRRATAVLHSFSFECPEWSVSELARKHRVHSSSMSRLLATLAESRFVRLNPTTGRYQLGFACLELATLVRHQLEIRAVALPVMRELALRTGNTVNLATLDGQEMVVIEQAPGRGTFAFLSWIGRRVPLHATAHGKAWLAFQNAPERTRLLDLSFGGKTRLRAWTPMTITSRVDLEAELERTIRRGYSVNRGELALDGATVGVAILDDTGVAIATLANPEPLHGFTHQRELALAVAATGASHRISEMLGYRAGAGPHLSAAPERATSQRRSLSPSRSHGASRRAVG